MNKGGTANVEGIEFTLTNAFHSSSTPDGAYAGEPAGIVLKLENGTTLYVAGDTCVFGDMQLIGRIYRPDVAVLPIGDHYTMGPREAAVALELLRVKRCVPCHWGTFPVLTGTPAQLRELAPDVEILDLEPGETVQLCRPSTYSIVACDLERREWGVAVQSKFLAVGAGVPWAQAEIGAVATQALANTSFGPSGLALLRQGVPAGEVVERLIAADEGRDDRQLGIVDREGRSATYTGSGCHEWAGGRTGPATRRRATSWSRRPRWRRAGQTFESKAGEPLAERLLAALAAGQRAGGDRRGRQSSSLLVVKEGAGYGGWSDVMVDLRVDDHPEPIAELERLYALHELYFGETPAERWLDVDQTLASELREDLDRLGHSTGDLAADLAAWAGVENLEERVRGADRIDPIVLAELRRR